MNNLAQARILDASASRLRWIIERILPCLVVAVLWGCTWIVWEYANNYHRREQEARFEHEVQKLTSQIERRLLSYRQVLFGVRGIFRASERVDRREFGDYVSGLRLGQHYPGVSTIGLLRFVHHGERAGLVAEMRAEGMPSFRVAPPGARSTYGVVAYTEALGMPAGFVEGHDLYVDPACREILNEARDRDDALISGKIDFRQPEDKALRPAFLMVLPVYRSGMPIETPEARRRYLQGWVYAVLQPGELMRAIESAYARELFFRVFDGVGTHEENQIFATSAPPAGWNRTEALRKVRQVTVAGRTWTLDIQPRPEIVGQSYWLWPNFVAVVGFFGSLLLGWLTGMLVSRQHQAIRLAQDMSRKWLASESQFRVFFEKNGAAMLLFSPDSGEIVRANQAAADFYGYPLDFMVGMELSEIDILSLAEIQWMRQLVARGLCQRYCRAHRLSGGEVRDVDICSTPLEVDGQVLILSVIRDISDRRRAELALSKSEQRYRQQSQRLSDIIWGTNIGIWEWDIASGKTVVNARTLAIVGLGEAATGCGNAADWQERTHPDDRARVRQELLRCFQREIELCECEIRLRHEAGDWVWVMFCGRVVEWSPEGRAMQMVGMCSDITERKMQNEHLILQVRERTARLRAMSLELSQVEERERKAVAQDLHDGPSQLLAIAQLKLSELRRPGGEALANTVDFGRRLDEVESMIKEASLALRSLSMQLSPAVLRQMGLASALDWLAEEMLRSYDLAVDIHCEVDCEQVDGTRLNHVFRAVRELLINVAKHAGVNAADVEVIEEEGRLLISVSDSGSGFDSSIPPAPSPDGGYGLFSVCERINLIGGEVQIDSRPGDGAVVVLVVPVHG